ncbi:MAG: ACT domain-containing protein [Bacilli bacterium]
MNNDFLLVNKAILPEVLPLVIIARERINKDGMSVTLACKEVGISRSVYYKYKDMVFLPQNSETKRAIISLKVEDKQGILNSILDALRKANVSILTIFQDTPVQELAYITIKIDIKQIKIPLDNLITKLKKINFVKKVELVSYE